MPPAEDPDDSHDQVRRLRSRVRELDPVQSQLGPIEAPSSTFPRNLQADTVYIDVLVPYTLRALCGLSRAPDRAADGTCEVTSKRVELVEEQVQLAISEANTAFEKSGIPGRLRLTEAFLVGLEDMQPYDETQYTYGEILNQVAIPNDGILEGVHYSRDQSGADIVALLVDNQSSCGLAFTGYPVAHDWTFSVINWMCSTGYYGLAHETMHNLGAAHDRITQQCGPTECCKPGCFNYGYLHPNGYFRTIMANGCPQNKNCPRVQMFSQPRYPLIVGSASFAVGDQYNDNAQQIVNTWNTVASYRSVPVANNPSMGLRLPPPIYAPPKPPTRPLTADPTSSPTAELTLNPTLFPTRFPTVSPTRHPTTSPTRFPTTSPTRFPTISPTRFPTPLPTIKPTSSPTSSPTKLPTRRPTEFPTAIPTAIPTLQQTIPLTNHPTWTLVNGSGEILLTNSPTPKQTDAPATLLAADPTPYPSRYPTKYPTQSPTHANVQVPGQREGYPTTKPTAIENADFATELAILAEALDSLAEELQDRSDRLDDLAEQQGFNGETDQGSAEQQSGTEQGGWEVQPPGQEEQGGWEVQPPGQEEQGGWEQPQPGEEQGGWEEQQPGQEQVISEGQQPGEEQGGWEQQSEQGITEGQQPEEEQQPLQEQHTGTEQGGLEEQQPGSEQVITEGHQPGEGQGAWEEQQPGEEQVISEGQQPGEEQGGWEEQSEQGITEGQQPEEEQQPSQEQHTGTEQGGWEEQPSGQEEQPSSEQGGWEEQHPGEEQQSSMEQSGSQQQQQESPTPQSAGTGLDELNEKLGELGDKLQHISNQLQGHSDTLGDLGSELTDLGQELNEVNNSQETPVNAEVPSSAADVFIIGVPTACGDGFCNGVVGENCSTCPNDCIGGVLGAVVCGNGVCEQGENCRSCPDDCASHLGAHVEAKDRICCEGGPIEMVRSNRMFVGCDHDICNENTHCDASPAPISTTFCCGNGVCEVGESVSTCPTDCKCVNNGICEPFEVDSCADCQPAAIAQNGVCLEAGQECAGLHPDPCCHGCNHGNGKCKRASLISDQSSS